MSIGNLKTDGNKGNNFPWQLKMLLGQQCACDQLTAINANTDDVEYLLTAILTTLQANTEYEAKFVVDTCDSDKVYLEVRVWNPDTSTWGPITYYLPGNDTPVIPVGASTPGCLIYTDPSAVLAMILGAIQTGNIILTDIETNTGDTVTELQSILALYSAGPQACADSLSVTLCTEQGTTLGQINTNTFNTVTELTDVNLTLASILADTTTISNIDFATETTLALIEDVIDNMTFTGNDLNVSLPTGTNTSFYNRTVGSNLVIPAGAISVSVQNIGNDDITILTDSSPVTVIDQGISLSFDAQEGKTLGAFTFASSTGTSLYIVTQVR